MKVFLKLEFDDSKGIECERCMLSTSKGGKEVCTALGIRPLCPEEGNRKDCPLIIEERKAATINKDFEKAVKEMESKDKLCCENYNNSHVIKDDGIEVTLMCGNCGNKTTFKYYGYCKKCGFWLDENNYCEMCEE